MWGWGWGGVVSRWRKKKRFSGTNREAEWGESMRGRRRQMRKKKGQFSQNSLWLVVGGWWEGGGSTEKDKGRSLKKRREGEQQFQ